MSWYRATYVPMTDKSIDISGCSWAQRRPVKVRRLVSQGKTWAVYSAHELLEQESDASLARPGHALG